jgi:hypothetical protein
MEDFERYIMTNPDLLPRFADVKERLRIDSVNLTSPSDNNSSGNYINVNRFITSQ